MTILISAANADVCQSMARIVRGEPRYAGRPLIGLAPDGEWPGRAFFDTIHPVPMVHDSGYVDALRALIDRIRPDVFIPFSEAELAFFHARPDTLQTLATKTIINPPGILERCLDKYETFSMLRKAGLPAPETVLLEDAGDIMLPIIIKPRKSAGSKNMAIVRDKASLALILAEKQAAGNGTDFIAQELIDTPDDEYTCALWRFGGHMRTCTLWRRLQGGMTGQARVDGIPSIDAILERLADSLDGDFFINAQLRVRGDIPYIFEINPRFSSTVMMRHKIGFSDFLWTLDAVETGRMPEREWTPPVGTRLYRVSEECIVKP